MKPAFLGILSLDTSFPRIVGDVGCLQSYPFPAKLCVVPDADSTKIVQNGPTDTELLGRFVLAAQELEQQGAAAIVATCGFLIAAQAEIAAAVRIPVMLSALSLFPMVQSCCPGRIGILTASCLSLGPHMLRSASIPEAAVVIAGLEGVPAFASTFLVRKEEQAQSLDSKSLEAAIVGVSTNLVNAYRDLTAILLECGNLPPYAEAIRKATGLPVFHIVDAAKMLFSARRQSLRAS
jgi:hypothetical protein